MAVSDIDPRSPAAASGLQKGDIIIGVNRQRINSMGELTKVLKNKPEVLALNIQRGDSLALFGDPLSPHTRGNRRG